MKRTGLSISQPTRHPVHRAGFTLLEVMVAIGLTSLLMISIYSVMNLYWTLSLESYDEVERTQVSRSIFRQITRDVQSVYFAPADESADAEGESSIGSTTTSSTSSTASLDPDSATAMYTSGLIGSSTELMLFVSSPDRNAAYVAIGDPMTVADRTSDNMIVRYFLANTASSGLGGDLADLEGRPGSVGVVGIGRLAGDQYLLSIAAQSDDTGTQLAASRLLAREVGGLTFRYFDGLEWLDEWDSGLSNSLPAAVEVVLTMREVDINGEPITDRLRQRMEDRDFRMVIALPTAEPFMVDSSL